MAGKSTISITFRLDSDGKGFKDLANDAEGLKKVIASTVTEAQQLKGNVINFAALATGIDAAQRSFNQLQAGMQNLADAYAVQEVNETRLATVMQQRMGATAAEIQSIKDLASAQQELGVIGDEVQLSGAQQIATFLNEKASLETLLPAMNNLLAQQKGLNATTNDAISVGNLMGKVMQGQASALREVGITFSQAEENVLKYGTESERAAMLAQVITNNVGNMNAQLAQTESGKQQQLANTLGDIKEQIGGLVNGALPFVTIAAQATTALTSITTLVTGIKTLSTTLYASAKAFAVSTAAFVKNKVATLAAAAAQKVVTAATTVWTGVQKILNLVLTANPIGLIITAVGGLVAAITAAYNNCESFRNIVNGVWEAIKPLANAIMNGLAKAFEWLVEKCKEAWDWLKNILGLGGKKVEVAVDVKRTTTAAPAMDLGETKAKYANYTPATTGGATTPKVEIPATEIKGSEGLIGQLEEKIAAARDRLREATSEAAIEAINKEIAAYESELSRYESLGQKVSEAVQSGAEDSGPLWKADAATLKDIGNNIDILTAKLQSATVEEAALINQQIAAWNDKAEAIKNAGKAAEETAVRTGEALKDGWGGIKSIGSSIEGITDSLKGNGNAWQAVVGIVDGFLGLYQGFQTVIQVISALTGVTNMLTAAKQGEAAATAIATTTAVTGAAQEIAASTAKTAVKSAETNANVSAAASGAMAAHASIPFAGIALGLAAVAAIVAAMKSIPKFADGGIVSGPTLAMVGEYAGASGNPEIIAPLDKLRSMLAPSQGYGSGDVNFRIKGRELVGIIEKENNIRRRNG
ncbi:MAG: hypothetical protein IJX68_04890 [Rikenellaceae bacterium]|nr:hypothetical protein [Rikenellaceae bacterium]